MPQWIKRPLPFWTGTACLIGWLALFTLFGTQFREGVNQTLLFATPVLLIVGLFLVHRGLK